MFLHIFQGIKLSETLPVELKGARKVFEPKTFIFFSSGFETFLIRFLTRA